MAGAVIRTGGVRAHDLLVRYKGPLHRRPGRKAHGRWHRLDLDDSYVLLVQEAGVGDIPNADDPILSPEILVQTRASHPARAAFRLRPAIHELVAHLRLPLADEGDLDHDGGLPHKLTRCAA